MVSAQVGIIGGTGIYGLENLTSTSTIDLDTPFGKPSSKILLGEFHSMKVAFISRHDVNHHLLPSEIPFRANIYALKSLGVKYVLSFGAVGSLKEENKPGDIVIVDQYIDRTKSRVDSFFGNGLIVHVAMGEPTCNVFRKMMSEAISSLKLEENGVSVHQSGTYVCIEGPSFSSRAESKMYQQLGGTVIGMTALPEMKLCREAEMAYGLLALVTDYDSWKEHSEPVTVEEVKKILKQNSNNAQRIVSSVLIGLSKSLYHSEQSHDALKFGLLTPVENISPENKRNLYHLLKKYLPNDNQ